MSMRQPRITEPAVISVYEDWRDLAERIGEDYFRTGDPSMLFAIFQGCQKDPKYKNQQGDRDSNHFKNDKTLVYFRIQKFQIKKFAQKHGIHRKRNKDKPIP